MTLCTEDIKASTSEGKVIVLLKELKDIKCDSTGLSVAMPGEAIRVPPDGHVLCRGDKKECDVFLISSNLLAEIPHHQSMSNRSHYIIVKLIKRCRLKLLEASS